MTRMRVALAKGRLFEPAVARFRQAGAELAADTGSAASSFRPATRRSNFWW